MSMTTPMALRRKRVEEGGDQEMRQSWDTEYCKKEKMENNLETFSSDIGAVEMEVNED